MVRFHSFLGLSNIPLCGYRLFLIQSSAHGHLGCLHVLAVVNNAAVNTAGYVSFCISVWISSEILPFDDSHSNRYEVMSHCDFNLHCPND